MKIKTNFAKIITGLVFASILFIVGLILFNVQGLFSAYADETDYTFETVPVESITLTVNDGLTEVQPRQSFTLSYELTPWYTTTSQIYFDVFPQDAATVEEVEAISVIGGKAKGQAVVTVSSDAVVGKPLTIIASADNTESNPVNIAVSKIPVTGLKLELVGDDNKLHIGKTRSLTHEFFPSYASDQNIRYELSGNGLTYIESFDEQSGTISAKKDFANLDINSTVMITAYSIDNPNVWDSVTLSLFIPTTTVELSASTPLGGRNSANMPLAVAGSEHAETVSLHTKINGTVSAGLNYVIVSGQDYVVNGIVLTDGTFSLKSTASWTPSMKVPHAEVKVKVAYSDGYDEIVIYIYVPIESIAFKNSAPTNVENFRSYDLEAEAFPKYATYLADKTSPIGYTLNGLSSDIASVDTHGRLTLPKSLTSKNTIINYEAHLLGAWDNVDAAPLTHDIMIDPVYATEFKSVVIKKNGTAIDSPNIKVLPSDTLSFEVDYTIDNVTEIEFSLSENSEILSTSGNSISIAAINLMKSDNPFVNVSVNYNNGSKNFSVNKSISIFVPAESATIANEKFHRDESLNLNALLTINEHGFASDKTITWGNPTIENYNDDITATCENGYLQINSRAHAGTIVSVPYKTSGRDTWQYAEFTVAPLSGTFEVSYGKQGEYSINANAPQLEEGKSVELLLKFKKDGNIYNAVGGAKTLGLSYSIEISDNATLEAGKQLDDYDSFLLTAKSNTSGINNYITYVIKVSDGTSTYYVRTKNLQNNDTIECLTKPIAIFNRISGTISVSNTSVRVESTLNLSGWDNLATFNKKDLVWSISGGTIDENHKITKLPDALFMLNISAEQTYNDVKISFSTQVPFSIVRYLHDSNVVYRDYKKQNSSITIIGSGYCSSPQYSQVGWSTSAEGASEYEFGSTYNGSTDLELYAVWEPVHAYLRISNKGDDHGWKIDVTNPFGSEITVEYNRYMCFAEDAAGWKGLKHISTEKFVGGETKNIKIEGNGTATSVVFSYIHIDGSRLITYADCLTGQGGIKVHHNII